MIINEKKLQELLLQCDKFVENGSGKEALRELVEAQKRLESVLTGVKTNIAQQLKNEGLKFVKHDNVKVTISESGAKYKLIDETICPPSCMNVKLDPKAVDAFLENNNVLPDGVIIASRNTSLRIEVKDE